MGSPADFDFWLGDWSVSWNGGEARGTNSVSREFGDRVIYERFDGRPGVEFVGMSVSVYREDVDRWFQTWVDDWGNYYDLEGRFEDGEMTLLCEQPLPDRTVSLRMRFSDIEQDRFTWRWEQLVEGDWKVLWELAYERRTT